MTIFSDVLAELKEKKRKQEIAMLQLEEKLERDRQSFISTNNPTIERVKNIFEAEAESIKLDGGDAIVTTLIEGIALSATLEMSFVKFDRPDERTVVVTFGKPLPLIFRLKISLAMNEGSSYSAEYITGGGGLGGKNVNMDINFPLDLQSFTHQNQLNDLLKSFFVEAYIANENRVDGDGGQQVFE